MDRNRHGVPRYSPPPRPRRSEPPRRRQEVTASILSGRCTWTGCTEPRWRELELQVCKIHADLVAYRVTQWGDRSYTKFLDFEPYRKYGPELPPEMIRAREQGWIYYVLVDGHYKIGYTRDVKARIKGYPPTAELLAQHRGTRDEEKTLHRRFSAYRVAGREWYAMADEIKQYIDSVITIHGKCVDAFEVSRRKGVQPVQMRRRSRVSGFR